MAFALVSSTLSTTGAPDAVTTTGINTTGANLLIVGIACDGGANPTVTDSRGNTWTQLTSYVNGTNARVRLYYSSPSSVGTGHTFTMGGTFNYGSVNVLAFSGAKTSTPADQQNGTSGFIGSSGTGSITPTENNELIVSMISCNGQCTPTTIDSGFTKVFEIDFASGVSYGSAIAYKIQTTAVAVNPIWTRNTANGTALTIASFKVA